MCLGCTPRLAVITSNPSKLSHRLHAAAGCLCTQGSSIVRHSWCTYREPVVLVHLFLQPKLPTYCPTIPSGVVAEVTAVLSQRVEDAPRWLGGERHRRCHARRHGQQRAWLHVRILASVARRRAAVARVGRPPVARLAAPSVEVIVTIQLQLECVRDGRGRGVQFCHHKQSVNTGP